MPYTPLKIVIPDPCSEDWDKMEPVSGTTARHCASCVKNVVDFTGFTDAQMHAYVREHPGKMCGRFRADQLNRPLRAAAKPVSNPLRVAAAAAGLMLAASGCEPDNLADRATLGAPEATEWVTTFEDGIVLTPPATGYFTPSEVPEEKVAEVVVPDAAPPPSPPEIIEEVGEMEWIVGDIDYDDPEEIMPPFPPPPPPPPVVGRITTTGNITPESVHIPPPPVCAPAFSDSLLPDNIRPAIVNESMIMGLVSFTPPEPTGMDLFRDTLKSILPPSTKPTIKQTSHPRPRPNLTPPHLNNITLFPNPFVDKINLEIDVPEATKLRLVLLDASGRRVYSERWNTRPGYNTLVLSPPQRRLKGSLFYVQLTDDTGHTVTRPIVRR